MSKYPSQEMDRFNVRLPEGMRDVIAEKAKENGRSMNAEIVARLQESLEEDDNVITKGVITSNDPVNKKFLIKMVISGDEEEAKNAFNSLSYHFKKLYDLDESDPEK
ncbi:Arc family DNA-binding protein [Salmonella enterica]|nr:DNA-binding protein [Salmonella enterica]EBR5511479.1 Arc family DNA-binding protein [Salmonella enterica]EJR6244210.1 Arc family DNA-binding protein [Salmonella enterica]